MASTSAGGDLWAAVAAFVEGANLVASATSISGVTSASLPVLFVEKYGFEPLMGAIQDAVEAEETDHVRGWAGVAGRRTCGLGGTGRTPLEHARCGRACDCR